MGEPPATKPATPQPAALAELAIPPVGTLLLGKYRVEGTIGVGGMGFVVAAFHETLKKRVAMKMLLPELARRKDVRARFEREAQAAFSLRSEHICRVLDAGELPNGQLFITMEYLKGDDLGSLLKQRGGKLPVDEAIEYILQACEGLSEAHELEMVHRDLKPANLILVKRRDGTPCIKIIDFGVSKLRGDAGEEELTQASAYLGSPLYSSPEQLLAAHAATARSDIWSLGVILYRFITGVHPWREDDVRKLANAIRFNDPKPLLERDPSLNPALETVMRRCLHKDPAQRYASAAELFEALLPLAAPRPTPSMANSGSFSRAHVVTPPSGANIADPYTTSASHPFGFAARGLSTSSGSGDLASQHSQHSVVRRAGVASGAEEESGGTGWVSILALIAAAGTVALVAWRSQQAFLAPKPSAPTPTPTILANDPLRIEPPAPSASAAPSVSAAPSASSRTTRNPRGAASRPAASSSSTLTTPPPLTPLTPMFRNH